MHSTLLNRLLCRDQSIFLEDLQANQERLSQQIQGARLLVIGAAGSIGSSFVKQAAQYSLQSLHLVDISENNLVELVRDLRSSPLELPEDFKTFAIGLGSREFRMFLHSESTYNYVTNFSALKHVRSERDPYTLMRMIKTNVFYVDDLLEELSHRDIKHFFSVSTDKSVNPVNVMGASKALMERIMLLYSDRVPFSTARFANVAFSDGSLLYGFLQRLNKGQAISAPSDIKRYFITLEEAGQLCLLACFLGDNREIYFPKLDQELDLISFKEIVLRFLEANGYEAEVFDSEKEAKLDAQSRHSESVRWPCCFSTTDTTGEKPYEEFYTDDDVVDFDRHQKLGVIRLNSLTQNQSSQLRAVLDTLEKIRHSESLTKEKIIEALKVAVPEMRHEEKNRDLDQKM